LLLLNYHLETVDRLPELCDLLLELLPKDLCAVMLCPTYPGAGRTTGPTGQHHQRAVVGQVVSEECRISHHGAERAPEPLTLTQVSLVICVDEGFWTSSAPEDEIIQHVLGQSRGVLGGYELGSTLWALIVRPGQVGETVSAEQILACLTLSVVQVHDTQTDGAFKVLVEWLGQAVLGH
jgi:hypothetical protein